MFFLYINYKDKRESNRIKGKKNFIKSNKIIYINLIPIINIILIIKKK